MARPIYQHELADPDFQWLLSAYREAHPHVTVVESSCLPIVLILLDEIIDLVSVEEHCEGGFGARSGRVTTGGIIDEPDI